MSARDEAVEAAANAISECSGMRFDGFWSRIEDLEPEDREHALKEARAALDAADAASYWKPRTITTLEELKALKLPAVIDCKNGGVVKLQTYYGPGNNTAYGELLFDDDDSSYGLGSLADWALPAEVLKEEAQ